MWKGILNLGLKEFLLYSQGEFFDIIACWQISQGITELDDGQEQEYIPNWR